MVWFRCASISLRKHLRFSLLTHPTTPKNKEIPGTERTQSSKEHYTTLRSLSSKRQFCHAASGSPVVTAVVASTPSDKEQHQQQHHLHQCISIPLSISISMISSISILQLVILCMKCKSHTSLCALCFSEFLFAWSSFRERQPDG